MNNTSTDARPVFFHLITGFEVGGAERMLSRVLPRLTSYQHVVISLRTDGPMGQVYRTLGLTTACINMRHVLDVRGWFAFRRLVRKYQPVVLTTYLIHADIFGRILGHLFGIPIIVSSLRARFRSFGVHNLLRIAKLFDRWVTAYIAVSEEVRRYYVEELGFPGRKFTVVTNGLPAAEWSVDIAPSQRMALLASWGVPAEAFIIGTVSQLRPEKGVDRLIQAMAEMGPEADNVHCLLIGDGPERPSLMAKTKTLGLSDRVHFLGNQPDVKERIKVLDVFILPSLFEGMSNALLEAMATGRTIVVTDTPENREVITPETGLLLDTGNAKSLAQAVRDLRRDGARRQQFAQAARHRFERHFSLEQKIEQLHLLYHQLMNNRD